MPSPRPSVTPVTAGEIERTLERTLGVRALSANILNITVGGGIFLIPAIVAGSLGAAGWIAYLVCAIAFGFIVLCFAEAGSRVAHTGGPYAYVGAVFGPFAGYLSGVLLYLFGTAAHAAVASGLAQAINAIIPGAGVGPSRGVLLMLVFALFASVNARGVRAGARLVELGTVAKLLPLLVFSLAGLSAVSAANLAWPGMPRADDVGRMSITLIFAFFGVESALVPSGEVRDPARTVPRAIAIAIIAVTALYLMVQLVAQGILGADLARYPDGPLAAAAGRALGPAGGTLLLAGAAVSMFSYVSGMMLAMPRSLFAFARDGYLPRALARVSGQTHVPVVAIVVHATVACALAVSGSFQSLLVYADIMALLLYFLCCVAVLELRRRDIRAGGTPFRAGGGAAVPVIAAGLIVYLLTNARALELRTVGAVLAGATALYAIRHVVVGRPSAA
jgi:APA family basic amino acid/polyamine antiporter